MNMMNEPSSQEEDSVSDIQDYLQSNTGPLNESSVFSMLAHATGNNKMTKEKNKTKQLEERKGDVKYNEAFAQGLFNANSYSFALKGRGTMESIVGPLMDAIAIELRVFIFYFTITTILMIYNFVC